jgi:isoquinoline 1-oxidoreductase beta subunit
MAGWPSGAPDGRAFGLAFAERSSSLAAGVADISLDRSSGQIRVHRFWAAVDAGIVVQPDNARAQIEGSIVQGLSSVLFESVTITDGAADQSNFHNYRVLRMSEMPGLEIQFIDSKERPTGIGEPGVPIVGGAVANAFLALTGKPIRHMPFTADRVLEAIG